MSTTAKSKVGELKWKLISFYKNGWKLAMILSKSGQIDKASFLGENDDKKGKMDKNTIINRFHLLKWWWLQERKYMRKFYLFLLFYQSLSFSW